MTHIQLSKLNNEYINKNTLMDTKDCEGIKILSNTEEINKICFSSSSNENESSSHQIQLFSRDFNYLKKVTKVKKMKRLIT